MEYLLLFLEGIITFISPCLLPMIPIYVSYLSGEKSHEKQKFSIIKNSIGFVIGFSIVFIILGAFSGTIGSFFNEYQMMINIVTGTIVIILGINYVGIIKIKLLSGTKKFKVKLGKINFIKSILFGMIFSIGWTPCVGAFLGAALTLATQTGSTLQGMTLLLAYSIGLGIPFILCAVLLDRMKSTFDFIKKHYNIINKISGILLIMVGVLMITGLMQSILLKLSF